jgi:pimeloyl-ACP methyl ester carboxylesterase
LFQRVTPIGIPKDPEVSMKNRKMNLFFICIIFFTVVLTALSVPGRAEEADESNQGEPQMEFSESTPISPKAQQIQLEDTALPEALESMPVPPGASALPEKTAPALPVPPSPIPIGEKLPAAEQPAQGASMPSGLLEINGYKYPVYLFAPKDYKLDRTYSMVMFAPAESIKAEDQIEYLTGLAQRRSFFILAPYVLWPKSGTTPDSLDSWLLSVKNDVMDRFPINKKKVYLIGKDSGAHYAAYMAVRYPKEFSAAALIGEAWDGPFSPLIHPQTGAENQVPFYIALKADGDAKARNQAWFEKLQQDGYLLRLADYKADTELTELEFKKSVFDWLEEASQSWSASVAAGPKGWKGKFKKGVKDFFAV